MENIRRMGPRGDLPRGRKVKVWLAEGEEAAAQLAADIRVWREKGTVPERGGSLSREIGTRVGPGIARDVADWATDQSLPAALRKRAKALVGGGT